MGYFEFCSLDCGQNYCVLVFACLMQIVEIHAMDDNLFNGFLIEQCKWIPICNKGLLNPYMILIKYI